MNDKRDLDEEDVEKLTEFERLSYGPPRPGSLPDGWRSLADLPEIPDKGSYYVEELAGGITLGRGWSNRTSFDYDLLARQQAWEIANNGNPARVLYGHKKSALRTDLFVHCVFYKKDDKVYISFRTDDQTVLEQEVGGPYDTTGGQLVTIEVQDGKSLRILKGLGYQLQGDKK